MLKLGPIQQWNNDQIDDLIVEYPEVLDVLVAGHSSDQGLCKDFRGRLMGGYAGIGHKGHHGLYQRPAVAQFISVGQGQGEHLLPVVILQRQAGDVQIMRKKGKRYQRAGDQPLLSA